MIEESGDDSIGGIDDGVLDEVDLESSTTCGSGGSSGGSVGGGGGGNAGSGGPDALPRRSMGPALTSEAAGLSELIRRRGGLAALSDGRAVAAVLRAAAPRRPHAFLHQPQRARSFFEADPADEGLGGSGALPSTPRSRRGEGGGEDPGGSGVIRDGGVGEAGGGGGGTGSGSTYVSTTCGGFFGTKSPQVRCRGCSMIDGR